MRRQPVARLRRAWPPAARVPGGLAALAALLLATALIWHGAYAGFGDVAPPLSATVGTGTVTVTDDDAGTALFSVAGLKPGAMGSSCVAVTSTSSVPTTVKLYRSSGTTARSLAYHLHLTVSAGTGGGTAGCGGFVPSGDVYTGTLPDFPTGYGTAVDAWQTAGGPAQTRTYRFTYALSPAAPLSAAGGNASLGFSWEARTR